VGVLQGSILGPLLFNVYINSYSTAVTKSEVILYADDAVLVVAASNPKSLLMYFDMTSSKSPTSTSATN